MLVHNNSVLLTHRVNTTFANGLYALPGGKCEHDETATDAIIREAREELGIILNKHDLRLAHTFHRKGTENNLIALIFTAETWSVNVINNEPSKCDEVAWFALDQLPENMISAHAQAIACIKNNEIYSEHGWCKES
jgi:mutator protein MutT